MKILARWLPLFGFRSSKAYWEHRYSLGGDSGEGSYGESSLYKARVLNKFVRDHAVSTVIEFGCGDGNQLSLAEYPAYLGIDVSERAVNRCRARFPDGNSKRFLALDDYVGERAQLALSLDVIFHLVEDEVYLQYLDRLFAAAEQYVVVYSTSVPHEVSSMPHVRHRDVEADVASRYPGFARLRDVEATLPPVIQTKRGPATRFFLYRRTGG